MRAADGACVGDGRLGKGGRARGSSISEIDGRGYRDTMRNRDQVR